jgi:hypothetical protein
MVALRRSFLVVLGLAVPVVATALLYFATLFLLTATNRTIDPQIIRVAAYAEFALFFALMVVEVKNRW